MRQRASWTFLSALLAILVSFGCSSIPNPSLQAIRAPKNFFPPLQATSTNSVETLDEPPGQNAEAYARFASGISMELNEKPEAAIEQYYLSSLADPSNEQLALEVGRHYLQARSYDKAILIFSSAGSLPGSSGVTYAFLARAYLGKGETNLAIKASRQALKKSPQLLLSYQTLSEIYTTQGDFDAAIAVLKEGAAINEPSPIFLLGLTDLMGIMPFKTREATDNLRKDAVEILDKVASRKVGNPDLLVKLGENYALLGQYSKAVTIFEELLANHAKTDDKRDAWRERIASLYFQMDDRKKSTEIFEELAKENPQKFPQAFYFVGSIAFEEKNYPKAIENLKQSRELAAGFEPPYYLLAESYLATHADTEAEEILRQARLQFPTSFTAEMSSGLVYGRLKKFKEAVFHFATAEILGAREPSRLTSQFYFHYASALERNGQFEDAEKNLLKSLSISSNYVESLNYLGYMYAEKGIHLDSALDMIQRALVQEPTNGAFLDSLAWVLFKMNKLDEALVQIEKAVNSIPEQDATVLDHMGDILDRLGRMDEAEQAWKKSLSIEKSKEVEAKLKKAKT